jgi:D-glycero-beta-D-manno-heptose-7-phosphate kinase
MARTLLPIQVQLKQEDIQVFNNTSILVAGDVMLDRYWFGDTERISPEAPVPVVAIKKIDERLGGAANVARNIASLGSKVQLLGLIGNDEPGQKLQSILADYKIESLLQIDETVPTIVKLRVVARQQQLIRLDFEEEPDIHSLRSKLQSFEESVPSADVVVFSDYGKGALKHISQMIQICRSMGKTTLVDPKGNDYEKYRGATVITPNRNELKQVIGTWKSEADLALKAQNLRQNLGLEAILLTRSEEGMTLFQENKVSHVGAQAREVFDVSGAGDTVIGTLALALAAGWEWDKAMALANRAGGIVVGKLGTATVSTEELT